MTTQPKKVTIVNIYKREGEWCYAAFGPDGYDHSDMIDCADDAAEDTAAEEIAQQFPGADVRRVEDATD